MWVRRALSDDQGLVDPATSTVEQLFDVIADDLKSYPYRFRGQ